MILRVLDNTSVTRKQSSVQKITANYNPDNSTTTICFNADVVTLGIVATFLNDEYQKKRKMLPDDLLQQLDEAINKTIYLNNKKEGYI